MIKGSSGNEAHSLKTKDTTDTSLETSMENNNPKVSNDKSTKANSDAMRNEVSSLQLYKKDQSEWSLVEGRFQIQKMDKTPPVKQDVPNSLLSITQREIIEAVENNASVDGVEVNKTSTPEARTTEISEIDKLEEAPRHTYANILVSGNYTPSGNSKRKFVSSPNGEECRRKLSNLREV